MVRCNIDEAVGNPQTCDAAAVSQTVANEVHTPLFVKTTSKATRTRWLHAETSCKKTINPPVA